MFDKVFKMSMTVVGCTFGSTFATTLTTLFEVVADVEEDAVAVDEAVGAVGAFDADTPLIVGLVQVRSSQGLRRVLLPPLLGLSKQYLQVPQSSARHPSHLLQRVFLVPFVLFAEEDAVAGFGATTTGVGATTAATTAGVGTIAAALTTGVSAVGAVGAAVDVTRFLHVEHR